MRRRLRKKLRRGEFTEYGFDLRVEWRTPIDIEHANVRISNFVDAIVRRGLYFGGTFGPDGADGFVTRSERASVDDYDREYLREWLCNFAAPEDIVITVEDAWR